MIVTDCTNDSKGSQVLLPTNKLNNISIKDSEDHKTYELNLLQNNEPFKYLGLTSSNDDDQKHQFQKIFQVTTEGSRILSISLFKNYHAKITYSRISIPKYIIPSHAHYLKNNMTHYIKHKYLMIYPHWDITELDHPHYVLDVTSTQVYN